MRYVYLLRAGEDHYKVGIAVSVAKRIATIQPSNHNQIEIITARLVNDAEEFEQKMHQVVEQYRTNGGREWFKLTPEDALKIAALINNSPEINLSHQITLNDQLVSQSQRQKSIENKLDLLLKIVIPKEEKPKRDYSEMPQKIKEPEIPKLDDDGYLKLAAEVVLTSGKASSSLLQRKLSIGYARAARLMDELEELGIISSLEGNYPREVIS